MIYWPQRENDCSRTLYPNNTYTDYIYDQWGRLETIAHKRRDPSDGSETILQSFTYQYDDSGNITKITEANGEYIDYNYDNLNRLIEEHRKTPAGDTIYKIEYLFDNNNAKNGNIHQVVVNNTDTTTFTYDEMNELVGITHPDSSTETLTYDDNGNLIQSNKNGLITTYEWNCFDQLTKVTLPNNEIVEFDYDEDGMLVKQESEGMERKFIQQNRYATRELVKNRNGEWETTANHIIHNQMLSSYIHSNSIEAGNKTNTIFYHTDHLGSVRLITDANGNSIDNISTDAYGNPLPHEDSLGNKGAKMLSKFNFIGTHGIRFVEKVKLHNMRARWYRRNLERFLSEDIYKNLNRFYYSSNPVSYIDPSGEIQIFHLYGPEERFRKFQNFGVYVKSAPLDFTNLLSAIEKSYNDHTILYIYAHAAIAGTEALSYMLYLDGYYDIPKHYELAISWHVLFKLLDKRETALRKSYSESGKCYKFLWVVVNACASGVVVPPDTPPAPGGTPEEQEIRKEIIAKANVDAKRFLSYVDNSNSLIYTGWSNTASYNDSMIY